MDTKRYLRIGCSVLFVCSFIVAGALYCLRDGKTLFDLYLPAGQWNDEFSYYKQVEGIIRYGIPQGYWGFSETHAERLTFAAWSVACLLPYAFLGKIFGWHLYSPILFNLLFVTAALALFLVWARPRVQQMLAFVVVVLLTPVLTRYAISGMSEPLFYAFVIAMAAVYFRLERQYSPAVVVFAYLLCSYFTIARPYMILMLLIPFYYWQKHSRALAIGCTASLFLLLAAAYAMVSHYLCAPYFYSIIDISVFTSVGNGLWAGLKALLLNYFEAVKTVAAMCHAGLTASDGVGLHWVGFFLPALACIVLLLKNPREKSLWFSLFYGFALFSAAILTYLPVPGSRHAFTLYPFFALLLSMHVKTSPRTICGAFLLPVLLLALITDRQKDPYSFTPPYRSPEIVEADRQTAAAFEQILHLEDTVGWENSVGWVIDNHYSVLYFLPPGFGVIIDLDGQDPEMIHSRYILAPRTSQTAAALIDSAEVLWENDIQILFRR